MKFLILILAILLSACGGESAYEPFYSEIDVRKAKQMWKRRGVDDYIMTLEITCECQYEGAVQMLVKKDKIIWQRPAESRGPVPAVRGTDRSKHTDIMSLLKHLKEEQDAGKLVTLRSMSSGNYAWPAKVVVYPVETWLYGAPEITYAITDFVAVERRRR